ncbi:MAG: hypothetical protein KGO48_13565 [Alphaproteobacteria bacterium]|nr:hypothetical protein [Alphaproteobacteria bacterium]
MAEVKLRISSIQSVTANQMPLVPPLIREFCYLQLRMVCELIALGCLIAHGDIKETTSLRGEWSADTIVKRMAELKADFFPDPVDITESTEPGKYKWLISGPVIRKGERATNYLTSKDLLRLYGKCGDALHRGSLRKVLSGKVPVQLQFSDIDGHVSKLLELLRYHAIFLSNGKIMVLCQYDRLGQPGALIMAEKRGDLPPDLAL